MNGDEELKKEIDFGNNKNLLSMKPGQEYQINYSCIVCIDFWILRCHKFQNGLKILINLIYDLP